VTSKYDRLIDYLTSLESPAVTMTFAEVEAVVGPLPKMARHKATWWRPVAAGHFYHFHIARWLRAGYVADRPDFRAGTVTFRRVMS
jgi:hypothetical protein